MKKKPIKLSKSATEDFSDLIDGDLPYGKIIGYNKVALAFSNINIELISAFDSIEELSAKSMNLVKKIIEVNRE